MDVWYVYVFILCLGRGLATSWSLVQGVLPSVKAQGGCRASQKKTLKRACFHRGFGSFETKVRFTFFFPVRDLVFRFCFGSAV
jgi:hypothetical protein